VVFGLLNKAIIVKLGSIFCCFFTEEC